MWKANRRRMPSNGKSSHCLWQGELKRYLVVNNIATFLIFVNSVIKKILICSRVKTFLECLVKTNLIHLHIMLDITSTNHGPNFLCKRWGWAVMSLFQNTGVQQHFHVRWCLCLLTVTWCVSLSQQELPKHTSSPLVFFWVSVAHSIFNFLCSVL